MAHKISHPLAKMFLVAESSFATRGIVPLSAEQPCVTLGTENKENETRRRNK